LVDRADSNRPDRVRLRALAAVAMVASAAVIWSISGSADTASTPDPALISQGSAVFAQHCQVCHGATGQGGTGPALAGDLAERYPEIAAQRAVILTGPKSMPSFATRLTDQEVDAVIAFTRTGL